MLAALLLASLMVQSPSNAAREVRVATTAELLRALESVRPGARILLEPGDYEGFRVADIAGAAGSPIVIAAATAGAPPIIKGGIQLSDVAHVEISGLTLVGAPGNGLNIDDGGSFETPAHDIVLRDLTVRDCGGRGNDDGIKLSGVDDFRIERCTVERWGRGGSALDMVGCRRGVIEACTFRDRERDAAASGVQAKGGSREIVIRMCRFEHAGERAVNLGGSTGLAYFRPKPESFEARDLTLEGCTIVGSSTPVAFVGVDGASVRWNTFYRPTKWCLRILQETREPGFVACRRGVFADNLVAYRASEVATIANVGPNTEPGSFEFARNYWFCSDDPARRPPQLPTPEKDAAGGADPRFLDAENGDLRLADASPARGHGADAFPMRARR